MDADWIAGVLGGEWLARPGAGAEIHGASIDTRELKPGQVFFAICGERVDGHSFIGAAADAGCALVVVERGVGDIPSGVGVLRVAGTRAALAALASACRRSRPGVRVIGVTGSNGKTTTVRMIHAALAAGGLRGSRSAKSHNNALGVPLTLLNVGPDDHYVVCEIGTSAPGEIARLAEIAEPDVAVITSIGMSHFEALGSYDGVAREKAQLVAGLRPGGFAVVNGESAVLAEALEALGIAHVTRLGRGGDCDVVAEFSESAAAGSGGMGSADDEQDGAHGGARCMVDGAVIRSPVPGWYNALNAAFAFEVARRMGVDPAEAIAGIARAEAPPMRLERLEIETAAGPVVVINDAYNANPDSMHACLGLFARGELDPPGGRPSRRVAVVGEMLELGPWSARAHSAIARFLAESGDGAGGHGFDAVILVGSHAGVMAERIETDRPGAVLLAVPDAGTDWAAEAASQIRAGDMVLLKGSRGVRLERLVGALKDGVRAAAVAQKDG